ncbi:MAG: bifunctional diaminohydroxyphosphoribosylaminopyrimidine deaminase/5-amino-6-(5-phosphoribosylamino)uracil reductase RibD [Euryarchaeota archaeon]|jgi:diaminohydroxyphosphoribosylaminopyrimidine deaminase/5-amino-6-(5-phosphoribosylamino)uracil reductase|nr:bifunctional diaminohydroxyphosphoribosylaminopyrimidine deaminase/5-amino-6-(5-phosphoribosylamino)uracil reductase RibD [Euryarchaeota archaeon]MBT4391766.1 bifunctional diaminohydroxyphosphoribosylaminopyrimidine deaminase/5-amino-6-(5-phosphoribosylamino)uracil reductase RibD [Euryarchaeota archaeon]MBT4802122.1 bifunctional diaminohydroxyphosphoribosylaminopyrimidine deaminase/5-amino-6-(5-phosphoribosylamino)uracil reductase RibD [Euryarchaeota archaeon]MBT5613464.1 bifunctional diamino
MNNDEEFMQYAINIANKGKFRVMPNPLVGCVLVKNKEVIAEGWHDHIGGLHAEQMAIADAEARGVSLQGATAYITLEPCNHFGRTPPCTESLLWAGIKKVVIGALDPNPTVRGGGLEVLQNEGFDFKTGILKEACEEQMEAFMHWCKNRRPLVTLKAATDINGRIDGNKDVPAERFSNEESLKLVQDLRAESMAILIGVNTAIRDNPSLTVRGRDIGPRDRPVRVVIDPNNRILNDSNLMNDGLAPTLLVQISEFDKTNDKEHVERVVISENKEIDILKILDMLGDRKIQSLLVEGGSNTWMRFLESGFVDKAHLCVSNMELSGESNEIFSKEYLLNSGLTKIRDIKISNDTVSLWKK